MGLTMSREIQALKNARLVFNVLARAVKAEEHDATTFPNEEALRDYLKEHPRAKPENHDVRRPKHDDTAKPAEKENVEKASKRAIKKIEWVEDMLARHHKKEDANYAVPLHEQMAPIMGEYRKDVNEMLDGINHIPPGKDRERAKQIAKAIDNAMEAPSKEMGFRWNRPDRKAYLPPEHVEKILKTTKPLIHELDQLFQGQRTLIAGK